MKLLRLSAIPLRVGLVIALVALAGLGLLASDVAVTTAMQKSLLSRVDHELLDSMRFFGPHARDTRSRPPGPPPDSNRGPTRFFIWERDAAGKTLRLEDRAATVNGSPVTPALPDQLPTKPITVGSDGGATLNWRIVSVTNKYGTTVMGMPLQDNEETVTRLVVFQAGVGTVVLLVIGVATFFVVRRSLRRLREVETTAAAIAAGDLHRRVPVRGTNTEVDRLSEALNVMLSQIQDGVSAIEESEGAARRSESKMRRFVADASHELRTPLTTIRGFAELYRQGAMTDVGTLMNRIEGESARMGLLVEDLLMLARLDAQRPLDQRPVDLLELAGDAVHNARALAAKRGAAERHIGLSLVDGEGTLEIVGDRARLQQVLANLIGNALIHTPADAEITVRLTPLADRVRLEVADAGPGMSTEQVERIFERFYRTDSSRTRASGGTGLGLSIVQSLVEAHGGTVGVVSEPGKGTTFTVELPREAPLTAVVPASDESAEDGEPETYSETNSP